MSLKIMDEHRKDIEREILNVLIEGLENGKISIHDLPQIARFVLKTVDKVENLQELNGHLDQLMSQWPVFNHPGIHEKKK